MGLRPLLDLEASSLRNPEPTPCSNEEVKLRKQKLTLDGLYHIFLSLSDLHLWVSCA